MNEKKSIQQARNNLILSSIILCITGLIFMIFSETMVNMIGWILGSILCVVGIIKLIGYIRRRFSVLDLIYSIVSLLAGILIFVHPGWVMSLLSMIVGIYVLMEGALKIKISIDAKKQQARSWWILFIFALISVLIGILLLFQSFDIGKLFMFFVGLALLLGGVQNIIHAIYTGKILQDISTEVIDMDDYIDK